ncbi:ABC transporter permease [Paenibacillus marinisediminis]
MTRLIRVMRSELIKLKRNRLMSLLLVSPLLALVIGYMFPVETNNPHAWGMMLSMMAAAHSILFLPLLSGIIASSLCRYEHANGGWKQTLALPVSRTHVYVVKLLLVAGLLLVIQLLFLAAVLGVGWYKGFPGTPWDLLLRSVLGGYVTTLSLAMLQLFVSTVWANFAAPMTINVILTLPNLLVIQSKYAPYYPWSQPALAMLPRDINEFGLNIPLDMLLMVSGTSFIVFFVLGLVYFNKKDIR